MLYYGMITRKAFHPWKNSQGISLKVLVKSSSSLARCLFSLKIYLVKQEGLHVFYSASFFCTLLYSHEEARQQHPWASDAGCKC